ncbi:MAG TPA: hypothetical protein PK481_06620 [Bacillota bacterium]|nr:hypothetical protein [Bacillota bacterium]
MNTIKRKLMIYMMLSSFGILISFTLFAGYLHIVVVFSILTTILFLGFSLNEYRRYAFARLIIENKIIHIEAAETESESKMKKSIEIFVSCFGILLDSKIIKFNTEGISLKKVEIGHDYILIAYGKGEKCETIKLMHSNINEPELRDIIEKFRRETGIIPESAN